MSMRQTITVSLPAGMLEQFERVRKAERRTRSELVREAVGAYLSLAERAPEKTPTKTDLAVLKHGEAGFARGEYVGLEKLVRALGTGRHEVRVKGTRQATRKGP